MRAAHLEPLPAINADLVTNDHAACLTNTSRLIVYLPSFGASGYNKLEASRTRLGPVKLGSS
jgi:hypothetical protein